MGYKFKKSRIKQIILEEYGKIQQEAISDDQLDGLLSKFGGANQQQDPSQDDDEALMNRLFLLSVEAARSQAAAEGKSPEEIVLAAEEEVLHIINNFNKLAKTSERR
jgi:hypothetical protein